VILSSPFLAIPIGRRILPLFRRRFNHCSHFYRFVGLISLRGLFLSVYQAVVFVLELVTTGASLVSAGVLFYLKHSSTPELCYVFF
jgi:hypothetical protein